MSQGYVGQGIQRFNIDDTSMGFRLLRLYGYQVSPNVFEHFKKKDGEFVCIARQSTQAVTGIFNLYRASQVLFQGENILEDAKHFSAKFLTEKRVANDLFDKWIITKDLPGEVGYALDVPWYASLPRLEARYFLEHYGGKTDVWIGKSLYRMLYVNNDVYLDLANWITTTVKQCILKNGKISKAAIIFEPERSLERLAWAKTAALLQTLKFLMKDEETRITFVEQFINNINGPDYYSKRWLNKNKTEEKLLGILLTTLDHLGFEMFRCHGQEFSHYLNQIWQSWLSSWQNEGNNSLRERAACANHNLTAGYWSEELQLNPHYQRLMEVTNRVCYGLLNYQQSNKAYDNGQDNLFTINITTLEIESEMQELVQLVLQNSSSNDIQSNIKNSFLMVAKSFYYTAYFDPETIKSHIEKVLFQKVV
ncbi:Terpenoid cyclases/protein prenyltransferase alpha-alpha toroid [Sesbania bispinosa]|nr:Terpenoid cyclases/protein prenyltransferase alpha-alpha toroid [Sesbania bispinosa]